MQTFDLKLKGLKLIQPKIFRDHRGFFLESFSTSTFADSGITTAFMQDNHSFSEQGCIRGMHFQSTPGQAKLIRVAVGKIFDVAVDLRKDSPTFGQWEGLILDDQHYQQLFIPNGFAHGFCVLSPMAHVLYKVSTPYNPKTEVGFRWNDPTIGIQWPTNKPIVSERDSTSSFFKDLQF